MPISKPPSKPRPWPKPDDKRNRAEKVFDTGGSGRKLCSSCLKYIGAPCRKCPNCGYQFKWIGKPKQHDPTRVKDLFLRRQTLIERISEVANREHVEDLLNSVETKLKIIEEEKDDPVDKNFEIGSISKFIVDRPFVKIYNFSIELSWKLPKNLQNIDAIKKIFYDCADIKPGANYSSPTKFLSSNSKLKFLTNERKLIINVAISKPKDVLESELESESDAKQDMDREFKILQHLLQENYLVDTPITLVETVESAYKNNQIKKIKSIGWNWIETDDDFLKKNCAVNSVTDESIDKVLVHCIGNQYFDFCEM